MRPRTRTKLLIFLLLPSLSLSGSIVLGQAGEKKDDKAQSTNGSSLQFNARSDENASRRFERIAMDAQSNRNGKKAREILSPTTSKNRALSKIERNVLIGKKTMKHMPRRNCSNHRLTITVRQTFNRIWPFAKKRIMQTRRTLRDHQP